MNPTTPQAVLNGSSSTQRSASVTPSTSTPHTTTRTTVSTKPEMITARPHPRPLDLHFLFQQAPSLSSPHHPALPAPLARQIPSRRHPRSSIQVSTLRRIKHPSTGQRRMSIRSIRIRCRVTGVDLVQIPVDMMKHDRFIRSTHESNRAHVGA